MNYRAKRKWGELQEVVRGLPADATKTDLFDCVIEWLRSMRKIMGQDRFQKEIWDVWEFDSLISKRGEDYPIEFSDGKYSQFRSRILRDVESVTMSDIAMSVSYLMHDLMMFESEEGCDWCRGYAMRAYFDRELDVVVFACAGFCDHYIDVDGRAWDGETLEVATTVQLRRSGFLGE